MPTENRISEGTRCARLTRPERSHDNKAKQSSAKLEKLAEAEVWYHSREQVFERRWGNGRKNLEKPEAQDCPMRISGNQMPTAATWWRWWWRRWWAVVVVVLVVVASVVFVTVVVAAAAVVAVDKSKPRGWLRVASRRTIERLLPDGRAIYAPWMPKASMLRVLSCKRDRFHILIRPPTVTSKLKLIHTARSGARHMHCNRERRSV